MANLKEVSKWEEGIYQFETSDPLIGGPDGIDNKQGKQLANRTKWLKDQQEALKRQVASNQQDSSTQNESLLEKIEQLDARKQNNIRISSSVNNNSTTDVASAKAVKKAYDNANSRVSKDGDVMLGKLEVNTGNYSAVILGARPNNNKLLIEAFDNSLSNDVILKFILRENNESNKNRAIVSIPNKTGVVLLDTDIDNGINSISKKKSKLCLCS